MREVILPPPPPLRVAAWAVINALYHRILGALRAGREAFAEHVHAATAAVRDRISAAVQAAPETAPALPMGDAPPTIPILGRAPWGAPLTHEAARRAADERATTVEVRRA